MSAELIVPFEKINAGLVGVAGGKGASLGEMLRAGIPVPNGFVVASDAFAQAVRTGDHLPALEELIQKLDQELLQPDEAAAQIAGHLADVRVPPELAMGIRDAVAQLGAGRVSVRSSATCEDSGTTAWAGQLETFLNVSPDDAVDRVRDCWMSIFSPPALAYGAAHGYGAGQFAVAVVVQRMVDSDISGIGFSVHPVTQEPEIMLLEACLGLGEAIVSGRIVPDQFIVERGSRQILESVVGEQKEGLFVEGAAQQADWRQLGPSGSDRKLSDEQVQEYAALLERIDEHYGFPVDTEWAIQDGVFQVLQARPITTLAAEYDQSIIDKSRDWISIVHRPMTLTEVSIATHWVNERHAEKCLGVHTDSALAIQDDQELVQLYYERSQLEGCLNRVAEMLHSEQSTLRDVLERGRELYREVDSLLDLGAEAFDSLQEAVDFFADVAQHTTVLPFWVLTVCGRDKIEAPELQALAEELRSRSAYPAIERNIIDPLVVKLTREMGFSAPEQAPHVVTWSELQRGAVDRGVLEERLRIRQQGHRFVYQFVDTDEQVHFVSQTGYLMMRLARQRQLAPESQEDQLTGQAAWPGVYRGRARVVLAPDVVGQTFEPGEVLVSIQSSPALMPFLRQCGAIVTDDGGIACHAAIIARELRKPTLIGTGRATSTIQTGDLVEVDTYQQTVRIVERG